MILKIIQFRHKLKQRPLPGLAKTYFLDQ